VALFCQLSLVYSSKGNNITELVPRKKRLPDKMTSPSMVSQCPILSTEALLASVDSLAMYQIKYFTMTVSISIEHFVLYLVNLEERVHFSLNIKHLLLYKQLLNA
jgi:hypothetical protein